MAMSTRRLSALAAAVSLAAIIVLVTAAKPVGRTDYSALVKLFEQWRAFERPTLRGDVPDYTAAAMAAKAATLKG